MNWSQELLASLQWVGIAFVISSILLLVIGFILIKTTKWAAMFWQLAGHYFDPRENPLTIVTFAVVLMLSLFGVRLNVLFSNWYNAMYTALQKLDESMFWIQMLVFTVLAAIHITRALVAYYLQQRFVIKWRENLNNDMLHRWMSNKSYYRTYYLDSPIDNPDQRIQQDVVSFATLSLELTLGLISSMVSVVAFTLILWNLSGPLEIGGFVIERGMVFALYIYILIATVIAFKIGRPLIRLNFLDERLNANYRYSLIRVREYAESIAFYAGEVIESNKLLQRFKAVIENVWAIVHRSLKFQGFNLLVSQTAVIFPFIIQAPRFFSQQISLGDMIQTSQAFGNLTDNLSFFRTAYDNFAQYRAVLERLTGFDVNIERADNLPVPKIETEGERVALEDVGVTTPLGRELVKHLNLSVNKGESLLIQGPSGSGKTTILRTIAGLWPYSTGRIVRPLEGVLFLSQKPYLPEGPLVDTLFYPNPVPENGQQLALEVLEKVALSHLVNRLDHDSSWTHSLSLGEQQRVAFARILLMKPIAAFLDEATSAMDEGLEFAMYQLLHRELPDLRLISIGHRSTLHIHHSHILTLKEGAQWEIEVRSNQAGVQE